MKEWIVKLGFIVRKCFFPVGSVCCMLTWQKKQISIFLTSIRKVTIFCHHYLCEEYRESVGNAESRYSSAKVLGNYWSGSKGPSNAWKGTKQPVNDWAVKGSVNAFAAPAGDYKRTAAGRGVWTQSSFSSRGPPIQDRKGCYIDIVSAKRDGRFC